ncbi:MAG: STAS domain-containing protein [Terriglobales bacterium]
MLLRTSTRMFGPVAILDCEGRIVFGEETALLHLQVKNVLADSKSVVLNLAKVNYIDSSGVGEVVGLYASAQRVGAKIVLAGVSGRARDVLEIMKLTTIFETYATAEEAAESFNPQAGLTTAAEGLG